MEDSIGIDIGLNTIKFGCWDNNRVYIFDQNYVENYITLEKDETPSFNNKYNPNLLKYSIYDINKIIGKKFNDKDLQENMQKWPFKIEKDLNTDKPLIVIENRNKKKQYYYPEKILMMLFNYVKGIIKSYGFSSIINIVLTVPLYFNNSQKEAYINSAKYSELNVLKLIKTTSASALTYYDFNKVYTKKNILIFDFGITLEISIFSIDKNLIEEKSSYYDINYGLDFILNELVELCINKFKYKTGIDIHNNERSVLRLKKQCEEVIYILSKDYEYDFSIDHIFKGYDFYEKISRDDLKINSKKIIESIKIVLTKAKLKKENIDDIFFTGILSLNLEIKDCVLNFFNKKINNYNNYKYDAAAYGAVIQLSIINKQYYNNDLTLLELDNDDLNDLTKQNTNLKLNEISKYFLSKLNKEMIDLKKEIDENEDLELNEAKMLKSELDEQIKKDNNDLESIQICDELIEKVKKWIDKMKTIKFEKKNSLLEKELIQYKDEKKKIEREKKEFERNYILLLDKIKKIEKEKNEYERNYKLIIEKFKNNKKK